MDSRIGTFPSRRIKRLRPKDVGEMGKAAALARNTRADVRRGLGHGSCLAETKRGKAWPESLDRSPRAPNDERPCFARELISSYAARRLHAISAVAKRWAGPAAVHREYRLHKALAYPMSGVRGAGGSTGRCAG